MSKTIRVLEEYKSTWEDHLERLRDSIISSYWHLKINRLDFNLKTKDFNHIQNSVDATLEALQILLSQTEGYRDKPGVQPYINKILSNINIHLEKISKYYPKNKPSSFKTKEDQREEGIFQRLIFKGERKVIDTLKNLNIDNNMENFSYDFFNDVKATIPLKDILCSRFPDILAKVETLKVDWDLILDNEFFINKLKKDIPDWNNAKHFWDQEEESLQFWISEFNKVKKGITIDGLFISPWLYYHINFFKTPIGDQSDAIIVPELRDNEWYIYEMLKYTQSKIDEGKDGGLAIMGTRRYGKSTGEASWSCHTILVNPTKNGVISSSAEKDILALADKVDTGITYLPSAFQLPINAKDWTKQVRFGLKTKSSQEIKYFYLDIVNIDSGSKRGSQKLAGIAPILFVMDEFAKEKFIDAYNALIPALETTTGWKTIPWFTATGGDEDLSAEADKALSNPVAYRFVSMDWNILNKMVPKEYRTWKERDFGFFIPAQMGQRTGHLKIKKTLSEFLNIESKTLSKIYINVTDWENNTKVCLKKRKDLSGDKKQLQKEIVYYPLDPEECFMSAKSNPYPAQGVKRHKEKLQAEGDKIVGLARKIGLERNKDNSNKIEMFLDTTREVNEYPHDGSFIDCPFLLYDDFPETRPHDPFRFVAGCLLPGEQVYTNKGLMNVEDVTLENKLINKEGDLVNIINLQRRLKTEEDTYKITVGNTFRTTTFTREHPIYVSRPDYYEAGASKGRIKKLNFDKTDFKKASELQKGDWIKYPNIYAKNTQTDIEKYWDNSETAEYYQINNPLKDEDFWLFLGTYLGDGCSFKNGRKYCVNTSFGSHEKLHIENYVKIIKKLFNRSPSIKERGKKVEVDFTHKQLSKFLLKNFGHGAGNKRIPEWVKYVEDKYKYNLLCGYLNSDGCMINLPNGYIMSKYVSISLNLLEDFQDILFSLGLVSSLTMLRDEATTVFPNSYTCNTKKTYMLQMNQIDTLKMYNNFRESITMKIPKIQRKLKNNNKSKNGCFVSEDFKYIYFRIKKIEKSRYTGIVYNFECDTHTFLCHHITTHNCDDYKQDESNPSKQGSIGAFYIFDRLKRKIVLGLATRPDPHTDFHKQMHMALDAWNAKCFPENEDMDFKKYLDRLSFATPSMYLYNGFDASDDFSKFQNGKRQFGWRPDKNTVPIVRGYSIDYTKDNVDYYDNNGNITHTVSGYERIDDIQLLEEMVKYKPEGNFDRLTAFGSCLAIDYYLTCKYITPQSSTTRTDQDRQEQFKTQGSKFFTKKRRSPFSR